MFTTNLLNDLYNSPLCSSVCLSISHPRSYNWVHLLRSFRPCSFLESNAFLEHSTQFYIRGATLSYTNEIGLYIHDRKDLKWARRNLSKIIKVKRILVSSKQKKTVKYGLIIKQTQRYIMLWFIVIARPLWNEKYSFVRSISSSTSSLTSSVCPTRLPFSLPPLYFPGALVLPATLLVSPCFNNYHLIHLSLNCKVADVFNAKTNKAIDTGFIGYGT